MAIAYDTSSDGGALAASPKTWSHTCTGSNRLLVVLAMQNGLTERVTGITYNGVALTEVQFKPNTNNECIAMWYLLNPASGSNTVSVTSSSGNVTGCATSYTGVLQSGALDAFGGSNTTGTTITQSVTTTVDNDWLIGGFVGAGLSASAGTNTTLRVKANSNNVWGNGALTDSNSPQSPAGSYSQQAVDTFASDPWAAIVASFKPAAASVNSNFLAFM